MSTGYHLSNIRALLTSGFTAEELRRFCYDMPDFRAVYDQLATNTGKADIIDRLLEHAERKGKLELLLTWAKAESPAKYAEHQPYELPALASPSTGSGHSSPPASSPPRSLRVFLCHASADKHTVRDLYQRLSQEGFIQPWLDEEELLPGQDWQLEIPKAVRASDVVIICLSPHSITKAGYAQKEIKFALDVADQQPEGAIFLIPLRLESCDVPERLGRWHWVDLFDEHGYGRLLRSLHRRAETVVQRDMQSAPPTPPNRLTITQPIHLELVRVPAGEFLMGSDPAKDKDAQPNEQPQHRVYVSEFYIGKYPVTNEQYAAFVKATKHRDPYFWEKGKIPADEENHPVVGVSWEDAVTFCQWLNQATGPSFRLPTEAEWEKAARGKEGWIYPWGNTWDKIRLNSAVGGPGDTTFVGYYSPGGDSLYGAVDMCGNVWEWCADWYDEKEYQHQVQTIIKDPTGPKKGDYRVLRGGAFNYEALWARCAARFRSPPYSWNWHHGLRVVMGGPFLSETLKH